MSVPLNRVANEQALERVFAGFESQRGVAVTPDFKLYGAMTITRDKPLVVVEEFDGTYDGTIDPVYGPMTFGGTYAQPLTYEDLIAIYELGVKGGVTGVSDAQTTPSYLWEYEPSATLDDLASATVEHGFPGMPFTAEMVMINDFTISADIDDSEAVWKLASNLWLRYDTLKAATSTTATAGSTTTWTQTGAGWTVNAFAGSYLTVSSGTNNVGEVIPIASNTATVLTFQGALPLTVTAADVGSISGTFTSGIADRTRTRIKAPGTKLYIDDATIGTTEVEAGFISFSVTHDNQLNAKRFMNDVDRMSRKLGRGKRAVTGQLRLEFDNRRQYDKWMAETPQAIRIRQTDTTTINTSPATYRTATIDLHRVGWGTPTFDTRGSNVTVTLPFTAFLKTSTGDRVTYSVRNTIATMF
jgi:hypothetical protein